MKRFTETMAAFKLVWVRVSLYFLLPCVMSFLSLTEVYASKDWGELGNFIKVRIYLQCFVSGAVALAAFIDQSMQKARADLDKKRADETAFLKREPESP